MACESEDPVNPTQPTVNPGQPPGPQQYFATVSWVNSGGTHEGPSQAIPLVERQFRGSGTSNLLSDVTMESAHTEIYRGFDSFDIENGQITLIGEYGDRIYGIYSGSGSRTYGHAELNHTCTVQGGTGIFSKATGSLTIEVTRIKQAAPSLNMSAIIYGIIYLNDE